MSDSSPAGAAQPDQPDETAEGSEDEAALQAERERIRRTQAAMLEQVRTLGERLAAINRRLEPEKYEPAALLPCVAAGTPVWQPGGSIPIDRLQEGDAVLACDVGTGSVAARQVRRVLRGSTRRLYTIRTDAGTVSTTGSHRFWIEGAANWLPARALRPGMVLRDPQAGSLTVRTVTPGADGEYATFNLEIDVWPTYFIGPGILVHIAGVLAYDLGPFLVYEGTNPAYPGRVYIGQTRQPLVDRQAEHQQLARRQLARADLLPEHRAFFAFMREIRLYPKVTGLSAEAASYLEQKNIELAGDRAMNRRQQVDPTALMALEQALAQDREILEAGYCI
jgi:hypothetical protein